MQIAFRSFKIVIVMIAIVVDWVITEMLEQYNQQRMVVIDCKVSDFERKNGQHQLSVRIIFHRENSNIRISFRTF